MKQRIKACLDQFVGKESLTIIEAMKRIEKNAKGILYIVNDYGELIGSLTDGDIRRWLIRTGDLNGKLSQIVFRNPQIVFENEKEKGVELMERYKLKSLPVLKGDRTLVDILFLDKKNGLDIMTETLRRTPVIIMAGGKGTRLYPYTKILPKPLIPIGDVPILERIMDRYHQFGAHEFYLTVNYRKEMIKAYFADTGLNYTLHYIEEEKPLGTAGSISLIEKEFDKPVIIGNCDILIEIDYGKLLEYHKHSQNAMTIVSSTKQLVIPYGVMRTTSAGTIASIDEKPEINYFINTGIYVVEPEYLKWIPKNEVYHMTQLVDDLIKADMRVGMYPISEDAFLDMGQFEEMKKMEERIEKRA